MGGGGTKPGYATVWMVAALGLIWGLAFAIVKTGLSQSPPLIFAGMRTAIGGLALLGYALWRGRPLDWRVNWPIYAISALLNVSLFFGLQTVGLAYLPSGVLAVLIYLQPVLVAFLAGMWLGEPLTVRKLSGLILGVCGVGAFGVSGMRGHISLAGIGLGLAGALSWSLGTVYLKRIQSRVDGVWLVAMQFVMGSILLLGAGSLTESWSAVRISPVLLSTLGYSAFLGVALAWMLWFRLVESGEVSRVSSFIFCVPMLSVLVGLLFLHEPFRPMIVAGFVLGVAGIYLVNRSPKPRRERFSSAR